MMDLYENFAGSSGNIIALYFKKIRLYIGDFQENPIENLVCS
jgi:hypothetical protein